MRYSTTVTLPDGREVTGYESGSVESDTNGFASNEDLEIWHNDDILSQEEMDAEIIPNYTVAEYVSEKGVWEPILGD
jgi:hypothetical protein